MKELRCPQCGTVIKVEESDYADIVQQVRDAEFEDALNKRIEQIEASKNVELDLAKTQSQMAFEATLAEKDHQLSELQAMIKTSEANTKLAVTQAVSEKDKLLAEKELEISKLSSTIDSNEQASLLREATMKESYEERLRLKDQEIAQIREMKAKLSTKMVGESLEQHCEIQFNRLRPTGFKNAYFEKDTMGKSKGDYIYRDFDDDGIEYISIMFEMKNETDSSSAKQKNEKFFEKLDEDRRIKGCEYAVLVSLLEPESEYYNAGIVDVSHLYPKMYVIRPQFFIPMITMLRNAALNSLQYQKDLVLARAQSIDITHFEDDLNSMKESVDRNCALVRSKFQKAIEEIDKSIDHLQKVRDALTGADNNLRIANDKVDDLSIKKLTKNNPTMQARFAALNAPTGIYIPEE